MSSRHAHFLPSDARKSGNYFRGTPARSALTWVIVSQNSSSTFSFDRPDHLHLRHPGQFAAHHLGIGQGVAGPPLLADVEVVESLALAVCRSSARRLLTGTRAHHCARQYGPS